MPTTSWHFVLQNETMPIAWTWRRIGIDGAIEHTSEPQPRFGLAVADAIQNGFLPRRDPWSVINGGGRPLRARETPDRPLDTGHPAHNMAPHLAKASPNEDAASGEPVEPARKLDSSKR